MIRRWQGQDDGFTVIELLVTVVVMGIVFVPAANFMSGFFNNTATTQTRFNYSHDAQIAAAYFSQDIASTGLRSTTSPYPQVQSVWTPTTGFPASYCGSGVASSVPTMLLKWDEWASSSGTGTDTIDSVLYVVRSGALHRLFCSGSATPSSDAIVVHNLASAVPNCSSCGGAPPQNLSMALTIGTGSSGDDLTVTLSGQRRQTP